MVDILIDWRPWQTQFAGETVTMELRPLKRYAMALLAPHMKDFLGAQEADKFKLAVTAYDLQELAAKIFPDHVRNIANLTVKGEPVTVEMLAEESIFVNLAGGIIGELAMMSVVTEADQKNSSTPSLTEDSGDSTEPGLKVLKPTSG